MDMLELIRRKRDGGVLTEPEIADLVAGAANRSIPEYQLSAWLMAVCCRGMAPEELTALTLHMRDSGRVLPVPFPGVRVDKHSTGGVGDKTSFVVAPIAAAAGLYVPMISGRALGHTGGTLDKLESIRGYRTDLNEDQLFSVLESCGLCIVGQTEWLVPADRTLYSLRDRSGTVESPYLICASIMSKKLAEGLGGLVLDVKTGSGAFLKQEAEATQLAELMVQTGNQAGTQTAALITSMNQPLGRMAGNAVEIAEAVAVLRNQRDALTEDLRSLSLQLAGWLLYLGGKAANAEEGAQQAEDLLVNGTALVKFRSMVSAQGGDVQWFDHPENLHQPAAQCIVTATTSGFLAAFDCTQVGWAVQRSGAGRTVAGEAIAAHAGVETLKKIGDPVAVGEPIFTVYAEQESKLEPVAALLSRSFVVTTERPAQDRLVLKIIA